MKVFICELLNFRNYIKNHHETMFLKENFEIQSRPKRMKTQQLSKLFISSLDSSLDSSL